MADPKYVGVQSGPGITKLRVGTEEVELTYEEVKKIEKALQMARIQSALKSM